MPRASDGSRSGASLGPNTAAPLKILTTKVMLCCGEDITELRSAVRNVSSLKRKPILQHDFRCYTFLRYPSVLVVWTGIGTGCMEPLLWEILRPGVIRRIVLVGTAGCWHSRRDIGLPHLIEVAHFAGTGIDGWHRSKPARPAWSKTVIGSHRRASIVSTDFFYGFSDLLLNGVYPRVNRTMLKRYKDLRLRTAFIDMETAQFYFFCRRFATTRLNYIAVKGAANQLGNANEQLQRSRSTLERCVLKATKLLRLT